MQRDLKGAELDAAVSAWLDRAFTAVREGATEHREFIGRMTRPTRMLKKEGRLNAAYWGPQLQYLDAWENWWIKYFVKLSKRPWPPEGKEQF